MFREKEENRNEFKGRVEQRVFIIVLFRIHDFWDSLLKGRYEEENLKRKRYLGI